jgi:hypothetical protein
VGTRTRRAVRRARRGVGCAGRPAAENRRGGPCAARRNGASAATHTRMHTRMHTRVGMGTLAARGSRDERRAPRCAAPRCAALCRAAPRCAALCRAALCTCTCCALARCAVPQCGASAHHPSAARMRNRRDAPQHALAAAGVAVAPGGREQEQQLGGRAEFVEAACETPPSLRRRALQQRAQGAQSHAELALAPRGRCARDRLQGERSATTHLTGNSVGGGGALERGLHGMASIRHQAQAIKQSSNQATKQPSNHVQSSNRATWDGQHRASGRKPSFGRAWTVWPVVNPCSLRV